MRQSLKNWKIVRTFVMYVKVCLVARSLPCYFLDAKFAYM